MGKVVKKGKKRTNWSKLFAVSSWVNMFEHLRSQPGEPSSRMLKAHSSLTDTRDQFLSCWVSVASCDRCLSAHFFLEFEMNWSGWVCVFFLSPFVRSQKAVQSQPSFFCLDETLKFLSSGVTGLPGGCVQTDLVSQRPASAVACGGRAAFLGQQNQWQTVNLALSGACCSSYCMPKCMQLLTIACQQVPTIHKIKTS